MARFANPPSQHYSTLKAATFYTSASLPATCHAAAHGWGTDKAARGPVVTRDPWRLAMRMTRARVNTWHNLHHLPFTPESSKRPQTEHEHFGAAYA